MYSSLSPTVHYHPLDIKVYKNLFYLMIDEV